MRTVILPTLVALTMFGCSQPPTSPQPEVSPKVSVQVDEGKASVTVHTPAPASATPEATPSAADATPTESETPAESASPDGGTEVHIDVNGVKIDAKSQAKVEISGQGVTIQANAGGENGSDRQSDGIHVTGASSERTIECKGENVFVEGASNKLTLTGKVGKLEISGAENQVKVENAKTIEVSGANNRVKWSGDKPESVDTSGVGNSVEKD